MIRSLTAGTREIDNPEAAIAEIKKTLDLDKNLLKHSLGIISCFSEFEDTGACKAICDSLPFDCVGATTCLCASGEEVDQVYFTITVLTSDDCSFKTAAVPIAGPLEASVASGLSGLLGKPETPPALLFGYFPLMNNVSSDVILEAVDSVSGGIPIFGTVAIDHKLDYSTAKTIYNGEMFRESLVIAAIYGKPDFSLGIASYEEGNVRRQKAIITESKGNILIGVNGKTVLEYFEETGLSRDDLLVGMGITPLIVDYKDGRKPVARAIITLTPENHAICGGVMPVNTALTLARMDKNDVLHTTAAAAKPLMAKDKVVFCYSCIARFMALGINNNAEAEEVKKAAGSARYQFACSGGEICPLPDTDGKLKNSFHNYTNVFCRLG